MKIKIELMDATQTMPAPNIPVLVFAKSRYSGNLYWARAAWIPKHFLEDNGDFRGDVDWDKDGDYAYWPEGWYEWNATDETHWQMSDTVTHWATIIIPGAEAIDATT